MAGCIALCNGLKSHPSLEVLALGMNPVGDEGATSVADLLKVKGTRSSKDTNMLVIL